MKKNHIVIAGNIGAGKTTLTSLLAKHYSMDLHLEEVSDNPYLEPYYKDMTRWALALQLHFLMDRVDVQSRIERAKREGKGCFQDRMIDEDAFVFAHLLNRKQILSDREYALYKRIHRNASGGFTPPDLLVYWKKSVDKLIANIKERDREFERDISPDYLLDLNNQYDEWFRSYPHRKLEVLSDPYDCLYAPAHLEAVCRLIEAALS